LKREKEGQRWTHSQRTAVSQGKNGGLYGWKEKEGKTEVCLNKLNLDLDKEIITKSKLRPLR